jgi:hypothetical protein
MDLFYVTVVTILINYMNVKTEITTQKEGPS